MSLFDTIPPNFFSVLASGNKEIYVDALMLLHKQLKHELNIVDSDYIAALVELLENRTYELEEDDDVAESGFTLTSKARLILNRFVKTGWVDKETMDGSFIEVITPRPYAIATMRLLHDLEETQVKEYSSLVFSTYSSLKEARENQQTQMYEAIMTAKANTDQLLYELKTLYHGIRGYMRRIQGQHNVNKLLSDHFDEYKELADRIYHPIKTMDSVYRYMAPIREILIAVLGDDELMESVGKRALAVRKYGSEEEARSIIIAAIDYVMDTYQSIGNIVNEIDKKHSTYTKLSVDTIRYQMSADQTIAGKLAQALKTYALADSNDRELILGVMERTVRVNRQEFLDGRSLWRRSTKNKRGALTPLEIDAENSLSREAAIRLLPSLEDKYSLKKLRGYIQQLLGDRDSVSTADIDIGSDEEFLLLLLSTLRAGERGSGFKMTPEDGTKETNDYTIPVMTFRKK